MFGQAVDYYILKPLTHNRNKATAEELDTQATELSRVGNVAAAYSPYTLEQAQAYTAKVVGLYFRNQFPIDPKLSYLDLGCGTGRLTVGLGLQGIKDVTGMDILPRSIATAKAAAQLLPNNVRPNFLHIDGKDFGDRKYDVVIGLAVMEHVASPLQFLEGIRSLLKPNGHAFVSMTPFHGPFGDHMRDFFRVQIPWRGVLFSETAILKLRRECFRPSADSQCYGQIEGGLNLMTISQYLRNVELAGLKVIRNRFDPHFQQYKKLWPLAPMSYVLTHIPRVRDYFTVNLYSVLRRDGNTVGGSH